MDGVQNIVIVYQDGDDRLLSYYKRLLDKSDWKNRTRYVKLESFQYRKENETVIPCISWEYLAGFTEKIKQKIPGCKVFVPQYSYLIGMHGWQYFDVFKPVINEIVVDAGSFDGQTESEIMKWGGENIKKIYAFEPDPDNIIKCREYFRKHKLQCVELIEKGTWNKSTSMKIQNGGTAGSKVSADGNKNVSLIKIDEAVGNDKVTFIKMDVEGAELKSLQGAKETIKRNKPRLAVCIYHKDKDLYEIPEFIHSLVPEYRFYIRHYSSNDWETVLYASCT